MPLYLDSSFFPSEYEFKIISGTTIPVRATIAVVSLVIVIPIDLVKQVNTIYYIIITMTLRGCLVENDRSEKMVKLGYIFENSKRIVDYLMRIFGNIDDFTGFAADLFLPDSILI